VARREKRDVSLGAAPLSSFVPEFEPQNMEFWNPELRSSCILHAVHGPDFQTRAQDVLRKFGAKSINVYTAGLDPIDWARLIWKIASGFFFYCFPNSFRASGRGLSVVGLGGPDLVALRENKIEYFPEIFSGYSRYRTKEPSASLFTTVLDAHQNIYCSIDLLVQVATPLYYCRIPNLEGSNLPRRDFVLAGDCPSEFKTYFQRSSKP
jgi:hypothetical protein